MGWKRASPSILFPEIERKSQQKRGHTRRRTYRRIHKKTIIDSCSEKPNSVGNPTERRDLPTCTVREKQGTKQKKAVINLTTPREQLTKLNHHKAYSCLQVRILVNPDLGSISISQRLDKYRTENNLKEVIPRYSTGK